MSPSIPAAVAAVEGTVMAIAVPPGFIVVSNVRFGRPGIRDGMSRTAFAVGGNTVPPGVSNAAATARLAVVLNNRSPALIEGSSVSAACGLLLTAGEISSASGEGNAGACGTQVATTHAES